MFQKLSRLFLIVLLLAALPAQGLTIGTAFHASNGLEFVYPAR